MNPHDPSGQLPQQPQATPPTLPPAGATAAPEKQYGQAGPHTAHQQYDFILNPEKAGKKSLLPGGNSTMSRVLVVVAGLVMLVILAVVVVSLIGGSGSVNTVALTTVAQDQTELARVANIANNQSPGQTVSNAAISTSLTMNSAKAQLVDYLAKNGHKLSVKELNLKRDTRTDTQLQTAVDASNFDTTFLSVLQTQLTSYQRDLKIAYKATTGQKGKALLSSQYEGAGLLLKQLKQ